MITALAPSCVGVIPASTEAEKDGVEILRGEASAPGLTHGASLAATVALSRQSASSQSGANPKTPCYERQRRRRQRGEGRAHEDGDGTWDEDSAEEAVQFEDHTAQDRTGQQALMRQALIDVANEVELKADDEPRKFGQNSRNEGPRLQAPHSALPARVGEVDPTVAVIRRLAFQAAEDAQKKARAFAVYARVGIEPISGELVLGLHINRTA